MNHDNVSGVEPLANIAESHNRQPTSMKHTAIPLISLIILVSVLSVPVLMPTSVGQEISDINVMMLISDGFGWNYFDAKEILESWGVNVTTLANSLDTDVPSCYNKEPRGTTADLLLNSVENEILAQFDVLFIPAGGQWNDLIQSARVLDFIEYAHSSGLIIATVCIGNMVLAKTNGVVNGSSVVSYLYTNLEMVGAGATIRTGYRTVIDNRFITGSTGGGVYEGYETAPTEEVCLAVVREALGYSFEQSASIAPLTGPSGTIFTITAQITDLDNQPVSIVTNNQNISEVNARIYAKDNRTLVDIIELLDEDSDGVYSGDYVALTNGEFIVDIEIEDTRYTLEIERESASFSVGMDYMIDPLALGVIAGAALLVMAVIIFAKKNP